jgi:molybdate transport system substrate-binding protein
MPALAVRFLSLLSALVLFAAATIASASAQEKTVTVFAAASMTSALNDIHAAFTRKTGIKVVPSYAASSALMKQIEAGAPADVFASADVPWVEYGIDKKVLMPETRVDLLGNRLVLIAPKLSRIDNVNIGAGFDLATLAGDGRIATGDVKAVPVGRYAKAALEKLGAWDRAEAKFAMADNVRAALVFVARGEAALGIVYATDARIESNVKVIGIFPADSHPPIVYPVALTTADKGTGKEYLAFLRSREAKAIFEKFGFSYLIEPSGAS